MGEFSLIKAAAAWLFTGYLPSQSTFIHGDVSTNHFVDSLPWVCTQPTNQSRQKAKQNHFLTDRLCCVMLIIPWLKMYAFSFSNDKHLHESWAWSCRDQKLRSYIKVSKLLLQGEWNKQWWICLIYSIIKTDTAGLFFILLKKNRSHFLHCPLAASFNLVTDKFMPIGKLIILHCHASLNQTLTRSHMVWCRGHRPAFMFYWKWTANSKVSIFLVKIRTKSICMKHSSTMLVENYAFK